MSFCTNSVTVMLSPPGQSGLEAKISASASKIWIRPRPRPQTFGLGLAAIPLCYYVIGHFGGKNRVKFGNFVIFPAIIWNRILLFIIRYFFYNYFWPRPWRQPPEIGLGLGLDLEVLVSFNITGTNAKQYV